jgi:hypothetical protein
VRYNQRQSVKQEASSCCADEGKIHIEFTKLNADTTLHAAVQKSVFRVCKVCWWFLVNKAVSLEHKHNLHKPTL